jgi:hypothetical protein
MRSKRSAARPPRSERDYHEAVTERELPFVAGTVDLGVPPFLVRDEQREQAAEPDPAAIVLTCANCGSRMNERKCKLICSCGYFASCSDYY